ncbi:MAG: phosphoribosylamine--glycine ligase [Alphaproteobacteria bacterium]|nr:phosphoribosylamine--glycine ligase [Alphaproteobacteria bacterium]
MRVLIIGSGGREHALCKAVAKSPLCDKLFCAPGNPGIESVAECLRVTAENVSGLVETARKNKIDFVIVGPEVPLALGLADALQEAGIAVFGPSRLAAELESSKGFMKDLCDRAGIPTATYKHFAAVEAARTYVLEQQMPIVIKADGLAGGKGVTIAKTTNEALAAVNAAMVGQIFGASGAHIVIEDFLEGEEASFFALCDGKTARFFTTAQDHKAVFDGDKGPNTGGMGAYSPAPMIDEAMTNRIMHEIITPTLKAMQDLGRPFVGVLYAGLMMTKAGPRLIEYNVRFGDPETEVMLPRLKSDLLGILFACSQGKLDEVQIEWNDVKALCVVMASDGYPGSYLKGSVIRGLDRAEEIQDVSVLHAGTTRNAAGEITANGGRVLCITATAPTIKEAQARAYSAVDQIDWPEGFCRRDIGWRAINR